MITKIYALNQKNQKVIPSREYKIQSTRNTDKFKLRLDIITVSNV